MDGSALIRIHILRTEKRVAGGYIIDVSVYYVVVLFLLFLKKNWVKHSSLSLSFFYLLRTGQNPILVLGNKICILVSPLG